MKLVREIVSWAMSSSIDPLGTDEVPGANDTERVALAALGGLAAALAGERVQTWPDPLRKWADAPPPPPTLVAATQRELRGGIDILANVYESLVTGRSRRRLGTFFTPPAVVEFMLDLAESHLARPSVVIDPGAGVGAFSIAATRRWPDASVLAVDVNVVTLGLLAARDDGSIDLIPEDFLRWSASGAVPREGPRLWIGNPPYTRHQELDTDAKSIAIRAAGDLVESRRAGLSAYFLAATLQARAAGDVICYLLPGSWLDTSYGEPLRQGLLASSAGALEMYGFRTDIDLFPGTRVAAMALLVGPDQEARTFSTASARITAGAVAVSRAAHHSREAVDERFGHWVWPRPTGGRQGRVPLGTHANVRRGIATGANRFFFLTKAQRDKLPAAVTRRGILRLRRVNGDSLTADGHRSLSEQGERTWLLMLDDPSVMGDETIAAWMREAKKARRAPSSA